MIKVLQNWQEIHAATQEIQHKKLPLHLDVHKNWDHLLLYEAIAKKDKQSRIVDLGCGECCTLDFLAALGFKNLHGIDLKLEPNKIAATYALYQGNLIKTPFPRGECDVVISVSVIEHSVDLPAFLAEVSRLLKPDGLLFITTDYWEKHIEIDSFIKPFGLDWKVFCKPDIEELIALAKAHNLVLEGDGSIPACLDKPIDWHYKYTFMALFFRKVPALYWIEPNALNQETGDW